MTRSARPGTDLSRLRELLLTAGAVAGVLCVLVALASAALGVKPLVFRSGSMSPAIETGALALARTTPAAELSVGDVVSVVTPQTRITHRIVDIQPLGDRAALVLQGDANDVPDAAPYVVGSADRVFFHVDGLGYAISWLSSPAAVFTGGLIVGAALVLAFSGPQKKRRAEEASGSSRASARCPENPHNSVDRAARGKTVTALTVAAITLTGAGAAATAALETEAAFTDVAAAIADLGALTVATTSDAACTEISRLGDDPVAISWTHLDDRYHYRVEVFRRGSTGGTPLVTRDIAPGSAVGTTASTTFTPDQLSTSSNEYTVFVTSYLGYASTWRSGAVGVPVKEDPGGLLTSDSLLCG